LSQIENLLAVHEVDLRILEMERELKDIPARKKDEETRIGAHRAALEEAESELKLGHASAKESELEIDGLKEKIVKLRQQQFEIKTNEEFRAIENEVAALEKKIRGVEDNELEIMEKIESLKGGVAESQESLKREEEALASDLKIFDERAGELQKEVERAKGERAEVASSVDKEWLSVYDRVLERKDDALVPLTDGVCGGCHLKLAPSISHAVLRQTEPVICDFCGRLLYQA
jgi:predicted  nucleic acid-binding Zn-ribbon protein